MQMRFALTGPYGGAALDGVSCIESQVGLKQLDLSGRVAMVSPVAS